MSYKLTTDDLSGLCKHFLPKLDKKSQTNLDLAELVNWRSIKHLISFSIERKGLPSIKIDFRHSSSSDSFSMLCQLFLVSYVYSPEKNSETREDIRVSEVGLCFSVGDLLKYAIKVHEMKSSEHKHLYKTILKYQTTPNEDPNSDVIGLMKNGTVVSRGESSKLTKNIQEFCNKLVLFNLVWQGQNEVVWKTRLEKELMSQYGAQKLIDYLLYGSSPSASCFSEENAGKEKQFATPVPLPDLFKQLYQETKNEIFKTASTAILRKINKRQSADLLTAYKPFLFSSWEAITESNYPTWALRNVLVSHWNPNFLGIVKDIGIGYSAHPSYVMPRTNREPTPTGGEPLSRYKYLRDSGKDYKSHIYGCRRGCCSCKSEKRMFRCATLKRNKHSRNLSVSQYLKDMAE